MSLRDEDPAIKMKLDYDPDKSQQTIILKKTWIIIQPNKPNVTSRMVNPEVKSKEFVDSNLVFIELQQDSIEKTRITMLKYSKFSWDFL